MGSKKGKSKNKKHSNVKNINKKINKSNDEELHPKVEEMLNKFKEKQDIRKEKKIWFWLILVPPIGLYKAFKYKAFSKLVNICLLVLMSVVLVLGLDSALYPNRVIDYKIVKSIEKYDGLGEVRSFIKQGDLDDKFFIYNVVTTKGEYDIYFSGDGNLNVEGVNQLSPKNEMIYKSDNIPSNLENVYAEIIRFFNEEDVVKKYGNIISCEDDKLENHQIITTDKGKYSINVEYGQVVAVFNINEDGSYDKVMQRNAEIKFPDDISKALSKNKDIIGSVKKVYSYKITDEIIEYSFLNDKDTHYKIVKYLDGSMEIFIGKPTSISHEEESHNHDEEDNHSKEENIQK